MKFTLSWLKQHLDTDADLAAIVETLNKIGLEVEHVHDPAAALKDFVIAEVIEARQHPNADRLRICFVEIGTGSPVQVVCGAPNARTGMKSVFAPPGAYIPAKGITLSKGIIRGVESAGMLCSGAELELSGDHDGILDLPADAPVGTLYAKWAGLDDPLIEINLTPNRPDAAGVLGVARDLDAAGLGQLKTPPVMPVAGQFPCPVKVSLDFTEADKHLAPAFALRLVRGVKNGPSPEWLQKQLLAIGLRPINALVDITNFLTIDRARPLHVFDAAKVKGDLSVRRASAGESLVALDGKTYQLDENAVVIADDNGVESLAGIMGGEASGCSAATTDVLIESALWDPVNIARTGRRLGINSDARYRFERGVDPAFTLPGLELATQLVLEFCGGEASDIVLAGEVPSAVKRITFPWSEVRRLAGIELSPSEMAAILEHLGFRPASLPGNSDLVVIDVPSWRPDIEGKADIVEEILRIAGVDRVPAQPLPREDAHVSAAILTPLQKRVRNAKRALAANGLTEAVTWSFISHEQALLFGGGDEALVLANPIASDLSDMRPSLLPGLVAAAKRNADRGFGDVALFEVGPVFRGTAEQDQKTVVAGLRQGRAHVAARGRHWADGASEADIFDAKADALALLAALGVPLAGLQIVPGAPAWFHPGRSGSLQFGPKNIVGYFGQLHPRALAALDVDAALVGFEIVLDDIPLPKAKPTKTKPKLELSDLMPVERDFAFLADRHVKAADLLRAVQSADRTLITGANLFDVYEGGEIPPGKKSIAIAVTLQPRDKTLTDAEIEAIAAKIIAEVQNKTGATLRG
ncbi:MAG: phenylalanine--tRNA ligase subunit beta [Methylovirgula sp.]